MAAVVKATNTTALFVNLGRYFLGRDGNLRKSESEAGIAYNAHSTLWVRPIARLKAIL